MEGQHAITEQNGVALTRWGHQQEVLAVKILGIKVAADGSGYLDAGEPWGALHVDRSYMISKRPEGGGYYVIFPDGRPGYMVAEEFERLYTRLGPEPEGVALAGGAGDGEGDAGAGEGADEGDEPGLE